MLYYSEYAIITKCKTFKHAQYKPIMVDEDSYHIQKNKILLNYS
jgi:hypothetical protein